MEQKLVRSMHTYSPLENTEIASCSNKQYSTVYMQYKKNLSL